LHTTSLDGVKEEKNYCGLDKRKDDVCKGGTWVKKGHLAPRKAIAKSKKDLIQNCIFFAKKALRKDAEENANDWDCDGIIQGKRLAVKVGQSVAVLCFDAVTKVLQGIAYRKSGSKLSNFESENSMEVEEANERESENSMEVEEAFEGESQNSMEVEEANEGEYGTKWTLEWLLEQVNKRRITDESSNKVCSRADFDNATMNIDKYEEGASLTAYNGKKKWYFGSFLPSRCSWFKRG